jgi:hypothetical protein
VENFKEDLIDVKPKLTFRTGVKNYYEWYFTTNLKVLVRTSSGEGESIKNLTSENYFN